jgi:hypothetical protein
VNGVERVDRREIVRHWLDRERAKADDGLATDVDAIPTEAAVGALLRDKPGVADVVWRDPVRWYRLRLSRTAFEDLRLVAGPPGVTWHALSPDGTVVGAARRIAADPAADLQAATGVDVPAVRAYRDRIAAGEDVGPLVVATRRGCAPAHVVDGTHRATARALHLVETGDYDPQPAYVAVTPNPVVRPARERLCGLVRRLRRRLASLAGG